MNSSTPGGSDRKPGLSDHARLLIGAGVCGVLALVVLPFDSSILGVCNVNPRSPLLGLWDWFNRLAPAVLLTLSVVLGVAVLLFAPPSAHARRAASVLLGAFALTLVITWCLKTGFGRHRPMVDPIPGLTLWSPLDLTDDRSFPSGHVAGSTAICAALWLAARRGLLRNLLWLVPPVMMLDRVCLAVHWPSDVLGGAALGLASAAAVERVSRIQVVDRVATSFARDGSPRLRFLLVVFAWLVVTRFWLELPLGRDPVSGEVVPGFSTELRWQRVLFEPAMGPALHLALEDLRALAWPLACWALVALVACRSSWRLAVTLGLLIVGVTGFFFMTEGKWRLRTPPDRFDARDRIGAFVDWHLHDGDPHDGGIAKPAMEIRQIQRGVGWFISTHHSRIEPVAPPRHHEEVLGCEWSGVLPAQGEPWRTPHLLVLGDRAAVEAAIAETDALRAARAAVAKGALVIVAHDWRSRATIPDCPSFEEYVAAGVHGFEVGNRRRETDPAARARLRVLDRKCREKGLMRFSFSDDHGMPAGSPCVTFLEGVHEAELNAEGAAAILAKLRSPDHGGITAIPLLFHPGDPTLFPPRWLAPPVMAFEYFRSLRFSQRASWFVFAALASLWIFRRRSVEPSPAPTGRSS